MSNTRSTDLELLSLAGRLLLEHNESATEIHYALTATALALTGEDCDVAIGYSGIAVTLAGEGPILAPVREIRYNTALQAKVHAILADVRTHELDSLTAIARLKCAERETPPHPQWVSVGLLGAGAAALALILGADAAAAGVAALSAGVGLAARHWLHRRRVSPFALPLVAALIGGVLGSIAIRLEWTRTPGLALIVPCLMLVPGPHFINGLLDLIDNYLPIGLARLGLATGILIASSLGLLAGIELTLPNLAGLNTSVDHQLGLTADMLLAGVVTCAFAVYYNAAWPQVGLAVIGGAIGHGLRFLALAAGWRLETATFVGGFAVGVVSAWIARRNKLPVAVIAFAGAVTMMPGLQLYGALWGALQLVRLQGAADLPMVAATIATGVQSALLVGSLGLGLVVAIRAVQRVLGERR